MSVAWSPGAEHPVGGQGMAWACLAVGAGGWAGAGGPDLSGIGSQAGPSPTLTPFFLLPTLFQSSSLFTICGAPLQQGGADPAQHRECLWKGPGRWNDGEGGRWRWAQGYTLHWGWAWPLQDQSQGGLSNGVEL